MFTFVMIVHILAATSVIGLVLVQRGKGAEAGATFSGGASQTVFGSQGAGNFFARMTAWMALLFFATSIMLTYLGQKPAQEATLDSLVQKIVEPAAKKGVVGLPQTEDNGAGTQP